MSFDNLMGYIMSISMYMQNFITIFYPVQEIGSFSLFRNVKLGKASTDENVISQYLGLDLVNINVYAKVYQNIPLSSRDGAILIYSEVKPRQNLDQSQMSFDNLMGYIMSISMYMQNFIIIFYPVQEIGPFSLFRNVKLGKASTDEKCHFAISWARSC